MDDLPPSPNTEGQERRAGRERGARKASVWKGPPSRGPRAWGKGAQEQSAETKGGGAPKWASPSARPLTGAEVLVQLRGASRGGAVMAGW